MIELSKELARRGHHVEIFTTNIDGNKRLDVPLGRPIEVDGAKLTYFAAWPTSFGVSPGLARALRARLAGFDVVHVHSLYRFHTLAASFLCRSLGVPYVVRPHGTLNPAKRARRARAKAIYDALFERRTLAGAAAIHYASDVERRHAEEAGFTTRGFVVPLGVDPSRYECGLDLKPVIERHPELAGRTLVTYLGRLAPKKGLELLVDAFDRIASRVDAQLVLAGPDDGLADDLRRRVRERRLDRRVAFVGALAAEKVALLRCSSVFVLPSEDESFALSVLEAMAAGVPVVVTAGVALGDVARRADAGIVVQADADALAAAILHVLEDRAAAERLAANARQLVRLAYSWEARAPEFERMYEEAAAR